MQRVAALFVADDDGRLQLLGCTSAGDVAARVAQALLEEHRTPSRDKEFRDRKRALWQEKDEAIEGLLTDDQRAEYDAICADCDRRMRDMDEKWQEVIQQAVERTRAILTPEQVKKYDEFRAGKQIWRTRKGGGDSYGPSRFSTGPSRPGRSDFPATATAPADGNAPRR